MLLSLSRSLLFFLLSTWLVFGLAGQQYQLQRANPPVSIDKTPLDLAWVGGLNNPQPQMTDLDNDGETELYVFDRQGHRHLAFEPTAGGGWDFAPELTEFFPENIPHWVVMRDYDGDGNADLFGHSDTLISGVLVYRGERRADGRLQFNRLTFGDPLPLLYYPQSNGNRTQIFVSIIDYPEVADVDCDGDMDILTFNIGGGYVEFFQNQSQERGYGNDSLIFELVDNCYGGIYESGLSPEVTLASGPDACATPFHDPGDMASARHAGSTLLTLDNNQDGVLELLLGDVSFTEIVMLKNAGDCETAYFDDQDTNYPSDDVPVDIFFFPASFYTDIDQDGVEDFVATSNQLLNAEDVNVFWYYQNQGQTDLPQPELVDSQYLVRDMIDFGTGTIPAAFDANDDGLTDLVVGNRSEFSGTANINTSTLRLLLNVGTAEAPAYELTDDDYLEMRQFQNTTSEFAPAFGDLNGDGRPDAVVGGRSGLLFYFENISDSGPHQFAAPVYGWQGIDAGQSARPFIVDLNQDGLNDLVVGTRSGRVTYYQNQGEINEPLFDPERENSPNQIQLGGIDARDIGSSLGYSAPNVVRSDDQFILVTGTNRGQVEVYAGIENNTDGIFDLLDYSIGDYRSGFRSEPLLADLIEGNDVYELVVGNGRGGLEFFITDIPATEPTNIVEITNPSPFQIFPNPTRSWVNVRFNAPSNGRLRLFASTGQLIQEKLVSIYQDNQRFDLNHLPAGVYYLQFTPERGAQTSKRLVVSR